MTSVVQRVRRPSSVALLAALGLGVGLAATFWTTGLVKGEFVARWQQEIVGARSGAGVGLATGIALLIGASTVVLPCGFPSVFAIPSILEREASTPRRLRALGAFAAGAVLPLAAAGAILGLVGGGLWDSLSTGESRQVFAAILYSALGLVALAYALSEFGILHLQGAFVRVVGPALPGEEAPARRSMLLGATFGAGLGIACPMPAYYALLGWVAVAASPWYGALVLAVYAFGRVLGPMILGLLIVSGASRRTISRRLVAAHHSVQWASALFMAGMGTFLIALFGGFVGLSLL